MYVKKFNLDNGVRCLYVSKRDVQISCINITFRAGAKNECEEQFGMAHFLEHMFFKGSKKYPHSIDVTAQIESLGGFINAYTTKDTTSFIIKIHTKYLQEAIDLLAEILLNSLFRKKDIEYEKQIVQEEIQSRSDEPDYKIFKEFYMSIFKDVPLKKDPGGTLVTINNFNRSSLLNFVKKYYTADNMFITISSNLRFKRVQSMIRKSAFTTFKATETKKNIPFQYIPNETTTVHTVYKNFKQEKMIIGFPVCNATNEDVHALNIISALLTGNMSSRLFIDLREKNPLVYNINSSTEYYQDMGIFYIHTEALTENVLDIDNTIMDSAGEFLQSIFSNKKYYDRKKEKGVLSIIFDNIRDLQRNTINKKELNAVKQGLIGGLLLESETSENIISYYEQECIYNYKHITSIKQLIKKIEKIKAKDILRICNKYFTKNTMFITIMGSSSKSDIENFVANYKDF